MFEASQLPPEGSKGVNFYERLRARVKDDDERVRLRERGEKIAAFFYKNNLYSLCVYEKFPSYLSKSSPTGDKNGDDFLATTIIRGDKEVLALICDYFGTAQIHFDTAFYGKTTALLYALEHACYESAATIIEWTQNHATHDLLEELLELRRQPSYLEILKKYEALLRPEEGAQERVLNLLNQARAQLIIATSETDAKFFTIFSGFVGDASLLPVSGANLPSVEDVCGISSEDPTILAHLLAPPLLLSGSTVPEELFTASGTEKTEEMIAAPDYFADSAPERIAIKATWE